jgi:phosphate uptake regulator
MLKKLFEIFKSDTLMDQAYRHCSEMLEMTHEMYNEAKVSLRENNTAEMSDHIHKMDIKVNKFEREVRRNIFSHLIVAGSDETYSGLVLASIVIDIERLGDYAKNMVDLASHHPTPLQCKSLEEDISKIESAVADTFNRVKLQFENSDVEDAEKMLKEYTWVSGVCDKHVDGLVENKLSGIESSDAVALALYLRYLKRIHSHLRNISTSVVNPFDHIGFTHKLQKEAK